MTDFALVTESAPRPSSLRQSMEVLYGQVVPSAIQVSDGTSVWETLAPAAGLTEQVPAVVDLDISVQPGGRIVAGSQFTPIPFPGDVYEICDTLDNETGGAFTFTVRAVSLVNTLNIVPAASGWTPVILQPDLIFMQNVAASQNSEPSTFVKVPAKAVTDDYQFSEAGQVTTIVTAHPNLLSTVNETGSIQGQAVTTNELDITTGDFKLLERPDSIAQQIKIRLNFFLGEWFLDRRQGMPYVERILVKNPSSAAVKAIFRRAILTVPGVIDVTEIDFTVDAGRTIRLSFKATLDNSGDPLIFDREFVIGEVAS